MGRIIYWTLIRLAILIPALWISADWMDYKFWWSIAIIVFYLFIIHPVYIQYKKFVDTNKEVITDTICGQCKHFDESAVLCMLYDKHPTVDDIPCDGVDWEPVK